MSVTLHYLKPGDRLRQSVERDFYAKWDSTNYGGKPVPTIKHVFYLLHRSPVAQAHLNTNRAYLSRVGNEKMLYHTATRECTTGDTPASTQPCQIPSCAFCRSLRYSFDPIYGNVGHGIYTTPNPAIPGAAALSPNSPNNVIMWNNVTLGNTLGVTSNSPTWQQPPAGYDSVTFNSPVPGTEMVVYLKDAICLNSIIVY